MQVLSIVKFLKRVSTGALRVWGQVGSADHSHLVSPLTVEPSKPRLCLDARFLNLWLNLACISWQMSLDMFTKIHFLLSVTTGYEICWFTLERLVVSMHYSAFWVERITLYLSYNWFNCGFWIFL